MQTVSRPLHSLADTRTAGRRIAEGLFPGAVVLLSGEMGAGKTALVKAICEPLGIEESTVVSPTYTLANLYEGRWPVCHVDLFRLSDPEDLENFDREDLVCAAGVTLVEWPDLMKPLLEGEEVLEVHLDFNGDTRRTLHAAAASGRFAPILAALEAP